eukprot:gene10168-8073_t
MDPPGEVSDGEVSDDELLHLAIALSLADHHESSVSDATPSEDPGSTSAAAAPDQNPPGTNAQLSAQPFGPGATASSTGTAGAPVIAHPPVATAPAPVPAASEGNLNYQPAANANGMSATQSALQNALQEAMQRMQGNGQLQRPGQPVKQVTPAWAKALGWEGKPAAVTAVSIPEVQMPKLIEQLSQAFKIPVVTSTPSQNTLFLRVKTVTEEELRLLMERFVLRPSQLMKSRLRALHDCFDSLPSQTESEGPVGEAIDLLADTLGRMAFELLVNEEDDLYNDNYSAQLLRDLKSPGDMCIPFLTSMVAGAQSKADAVIWRDLTKSVLKEFKSVTKIGDPSATQLEPLLLMLDTYTSIPELQRALTSRLWDPTIVMCQVPASMVKTGSQLG